MRLPLSSRRVTHQVLKLDAARNSGSRREACHVAIPGVRPRDRFRGCRAFRESPRPCSGRAPRVRSRRSVLRSVLTEAGTARSTGLATVPPVGIRIKDKESGGVWTTSAQPGHDTADISSPALVLGRRHERSARSRWRNSHDTDSAAAVTERPSENGRHVRRSTTAAMPSLGPRHRPVLG